jgi:hypothetical protein
MRVWLKPDPWYARGEVGAARRARVRPSGLSRLAQGQTLRSVPPCQCAAKERVWPEGQTLDLRAAKCGWPEARRVRPSGLTRLASARRRAGLAEARPWIWARRSARGPDVRRVRPSGLTRLASARRNAGLAEARPWYARGEVGAARRAQGQTVWSDPLCECGAKSGSGWKARPWISKRGGRWVWPEARRVRPSGLTRLASAVRRAGLARWPDLTWARTEGGVAPRAGSDHPV